MKLRGQVFKTLSTNDRVAQLDGVSHLSWTKLNAANGRAGLDKSTPQDAASAD